ncbi:MULTISPECIES: phospho-sugar mutase [Brachybacterium]|uniref:Phosphomannomutase n=1 Tax=Brachybacterium conglomeratum TaxID=47846 RepID=A0ABQ5RG55_9MICO|nr:MULTISPECIES: phospho-sugar mutase [Brachybacterium]MCT1436629.1 phospho-sugar mutase [Brachybacterium paraconglomeratum]GLI30844.1 phosphomannomutase [Brachybacterium conglomeratum]GLK05739.1 phosphomannomutase [Brachybacterium conglomeratum]
MSPEPAPSPGDADDVTTAGEAGAAGPAGDAPGPDAELRARVAAWIADDPDPVTRAALESLLEQADAGDAAAAEEIRDAFSGDLEFGTAGLRGRMAPGPHRINLAVVSRAARGLADHLTGDLDLEQPLVVIGFDARHRSEDFARASAAIMTAAGCRVHLLERHGPTPLIAFAVRHLGADAGIVVTASHNPPADNGYKVYLGGRASAPDGQGVQIVPPSDAQIAARIAAVGPVREIPRAEGWAVLGEQLREDYLAAICALPDPEGPRQVRIVHTAMHGVGTETALAALHRTGFAEVHPVAKQADPDPDFPTVAFPNPEEPGAIDLALELARTLEADVVVANDPDADRCAAAVLDPHLGDWRMLTGDELGVLLGDHLIRRHGYAGTIANSVVSSRWLGRIAQAAGLEAATTLTGFKWIARAPGIVFGYEEAIGYCVLPEVVRDKDGLSAALMVAEMAALARAEGTTLVGRLDELAREHGLFATSQLSLRVTELSERDVMMARLRAEPPAALAGSEVTTVQDLAEGSAETTGLPATDGVLLVTADDARVIVRPSGTEPKLKCYIEVREKVAAAADEAGLGAVRRAAAERLERITEDMRTALTGA